MSTIHAALIDYRFRMLPSVAHNKAMFQNKPQKGNIAEDFEKIDDSFFDIDDQTFQQNGIIVEPKYDLTDQERAKLKL